MFFTQVKLWVTLNEPNMYCAAFQTNTDGTPGPNNYYYQCMHSMILAHMKTYRIYKRDYYAAQKGSQIKTQLYN